MLTSNGNSRPTWQDAGGGGAWELQSSTSLSGTGSSSYYRSFTLSNDVLHRFTFDNFYWVTADYMGAVFSPNGGSSFDSTTFVRWDNSYSQWYNSPYDNNSRMTGAGTGAVRYHRYTTNSNDKATLIFWVFAPSSSSGKARLIGEIHYINYGNPQKHYFAAAAYTTQVVNHIRFGPVNYLNSSQGMRGVLKHETFSGT